MTAIFQMALEMSLWASVTILIVLLVRLLLRRTEKKWSYLLWSVVGFRLCCPVSFHAAFSVFGLFPERTGKIVADSPNPLPLSPTVPAPALTPPPDMPVEAFPVTATPATNPLPLWLTIGTILWCVGMAILCIYGIYSYLHLKRRLAEAIRVEDGIYESDRIESPFILGLLRPNIYLPLGLTRDVRRYVIAHERYHIARRDYLVKAFAYLLLTIHWFNPLCWLAFHLMGRDMEMSCDEKVLRTESGIAKAYSMTLLRFAVGERFPSPGALAFGESDIKRRIQNILAWKKPSTWVTLATILLCVIVVAACAANPETGRDASDANIQSELAANAETIPVRVEVYLGDGFPQPVLDWALELTAADAAYYHDEVGYSVTDAKLTGLSLLNSSYSIPGCIVYMYQVEWRIQVEHPENIVIAGGMTLEDGWITEHSSMGNRYLVLARYDDGTDAGQWQRIGRTNSALLMEYDTPEMREKYGDQITAVCAEMYRAINSGRRLTLSDVLTLSQKGDALTWTDFEDFPHMDIGSGIYIWQFNMPDHYSLLIGGVPPDEPAYIRLFYGNYLKNDEYNDDYIDIRYEDVNEFIDAHNMAAVQSGPATGSDLQLPDEEEYVTHIPQFLRDIQTEPFDWSGAFREDWDSALALITELQTYIGTHELSETDYLALMRNTDGLDGAYAERYDEILSMLYAQNNLRYVRLYFDNLTEEEQNRAIPVGILYEEPEIIFGGATAAKDWLANERSIMEQAVDAATKYAIAQIAQGYEERVLILRTVRHIFNPPTDIFVKLRDYHPGERNYMVVFSTPDEGILGTLDIYVDRDGNVFGVGLRD